MQLEGLLRGYFSCQRHTAGFDRLSNSRPRPIPKACSRPRCRGSSAASRRRAKTRLFRRVARDGMCTRSSATPWRGVHGFPLRECVSIRVDRRSRCLRVGAKDRRVEFESTPTAASWMRFRVFGEVSAYAPGTRRRSRLRPPGSVAALHPLPSAGVISPAPAPKAAPPAPVAVPVAAPGWRTAKTLATGRTNLRAGPDTSASVIVMLPPGIAVLVQQVAGGEWWQAKSPGGARFEGYIRQDARLQ